MTLMSPKIFLSLRITRMKIPNFASFGRKLDQLFATLFRLLVLCCSHYLFFIKLGYFVTLSLVGYLALTVFSKTRNVSLTSSNTNTNSTGPSVSTSMPKQLDLFFTSVSATTVSSMSTVEMEVFSNSQLIILTILMVLGGEVFTSLLEIQLERAKHPNKPTMLTCDQKVHELTGVRPSDHRDIENGYKPNFDVDTEYLKHNSRKYLGYVVLGYHLVVHIIGSLSVYTYIIFSPSSTQVLKTKDIRTQTFSVFSTVSTFSNCGFIPTNENMIAFKTKSGLLLLLAAQVLLGNTLYPFFLRFAIWVLEKITGKREFGYLLRNHRDVGYDHLLSSVHSAFLALTVLSFILVQIILFCTLEWNSEGLAGMSWYQRFVATLFQVVNSRHAGESVVDISTISSAILVLFVIMM
ncbi:hypothetical protein TIFTF001_024392 [Ficus carica]|uniref:Uncharacterized protein n=1 Tax=Ficus carica TaxID=3494 RepID=A0AA88AXZ2_FICCA|nr:hypothetical protein TIFTF001_024392 [Ficus carica]